MAAIAQFVLCSVDPTQKDSQTNACFAKRTQDMTGYWTVAASHGLSFTRRSHNMFNHDHMITSLTIWSFHSVCWINGYFNPLRKLFKSQIPFVSAQLMDMSGALPWDSQPCPCSQCPRYSLLPIIVHDKLLREMIPLGRNPDFVWFSTFIRILPDLSASFKRRWTSTWPMLQESAGLQHFILKGIATKRIKEQQTSHSTARFLDLSWTTNQGKWREWSKIIEGNGQRPSSCNAICFCHFLPGSGTS